MQLDDRATKWNDGSKVGNSEEAQQERSKLNRKRTQEAARVTRNRHNMARGTAKAAVLRGAAARARERHMSLNRD